jgi:hypothetical protein
MNPSGSSATQAGLQYADEVKDTIGGMIQHILNTLNDQAQDSIDAQLSICNGIRTQMNSLVAGLNLDASFLFGPAKKYFAVGMHKNFTARPEPLAPHLTLVQRKPEMLQLEEKHIDLYDCDVKQYVFVHIQEIIADLLGAGFADLKAEILDK